MLSRHQLPQIPSDAIDEFQQYMRTHGIDSHIVYLNPRVLRPIQAELNKDKILNILRHPTDISSPLIISKDKYLMDGHHRWAAECVRRTPEILCVQFMCPITTLVKYGHEFEGSETKDIHEIFRD